MSTVDSVVCPLFVPGDRPERFGKAAASGADAVILDLEDAVSPSAKETARQRVREASLDIIRIVRINAIGTPWHVDDLAAVLAIPRCAIMVPKAEASPAFAELSRRITASGAAVVALVETARGLAGAREIAAIAGVSRLAFGSIDYCADIGCEHVREALLPARGELVLASRLAGLPQPWVGVTTEVADAAVAGHDAHHARSLGYRGKLCIHPAQVALIKAAFHPTDDEVAFARKVMASGDGAVSIDGAMVDEPVRKRARQILDRADCAGSAR